MKDAHGNKTPDLLETAATAKRGRPPIENPQSASHRKAMERLRRIKLPSELRHGVKLPSDLSKADCIYLLSINDDPDAYYDSKLIALKRLAEIENIEITIHSDTKVDEYKKLRQLLK
jgi:hypothetical protein